MQKLIDIHLPKDRVARLKRKLDLNGVLFTKFYQQIVNSHGLSNAGGDTQDVIVRMVRAMIADYHIENNTEFADYYLEKRRDSSTKN